MTVANTQPTYVHHPLVTQTALPATANTARDGSGTITQIYAGDAAVNGTLVESIKFVATGVNTTGLINLFRKAGGAGSWVFIGQAVVNSAYTPSATQSAAEVYYTGDDMPIRLNASDTLGAAPTKAEAYNAFVQGGPLVNSDA